MDIKIGIPGISAETSHTIFVWVMVYSLVCVVFQLLTTIILVKRQYAREGIAEAVMYVVGGIVLLLLGPYFSLALTAICFPPQWNWVIEITIGAIFFSVIFPFWILCPFVFWLNPFFTVAVMINKDMTEIPL